MGSFSCPHLRVKDKYCRRLNTDCVPGRTGCIIPNNMEFSKSPEKRIEEQNETSPDEDTSETMFQKKRIYEEPYEEDGYRVLVDRLWPRGVSKEQAQLDEWLKEIAPSPELREWFNHDPDRFDEFRQRYENELREKDEPVKHLIEQANQQTVTLLYAAKDETHNHAVVLKEFLEDQS